MPQLTKPQIVDETIEFYRTNPRAVIPGAEAGACVYRVTHGDNCGAECALGRCLRRDLPASYFNIMGGVRMLISQVRATAPAVLDVFDDNGGFYLVPDQLVLDALLQPQYRGHDVHFWSGLQTLHDDNAHWGRSSNGDQVLTRFGQDWARRVIERARE